MKMEFFQAQAKKESESQAVAKLNQNRLDK